MSLSLLVTWECSCEIWNFSPSFVSSLCKVLFFVVVVDNFVFYFMPHAGSTKIQATASFIPFFILRWTSTLDINTYFRAFSLLCNYYWAGFTVLSDNYWRWNLIMMVVIVCDRSEYIHSRCSLYPVNLDSMQNMLGINVISGEYIYIYVDNFIENIKYAIYYHNYVLVTFSIKFHVDSHVWHYYIHLAAPKFVLCVRRL